MKMQNSDTFALEHFEGPLDFLLHLIQKNEVDIYDIPLKGITEQFLAKESKNLEAGAEFVSNTAFLLWLKSKTLLPKHEQDILPKEFEADPRFEIIHQLLDYCRFKQAAKELSLLEQQQNGVFLRGSEAMDPRKTLGIEHLTLDDLAGLFQQALAKSSQGRGSVREEVWRVADKIKHVKQVLKNLQKIPFQLLFDGKMSRDELIVTFLAVLELMKMGCLGFVKSSSDNTLLFIGKE